MRKSKIFDAAGNSVVFSSRKILARKTVTNETNDKSVECHEAGECDHDQENTGSKSLIRRPTFKEFEGRLKSRLVKSQSLDHEPKGFTVSSSLVRPATPGDAVQTGKEKTGKKGFTRRAREVFMNNNENKESTHTEVINKPANFISRLFNR